MTDPYAFADDPSERGANARATGDVSVIVDNDSPVHTMHYENDAVNADLLTVPGGTIERDAAFDRPGLMNTTRVPRTPKVGRSNLRAITLLPGAVQVISGRNINRKRLIVWTDGSNVGPVYVSSANTGNAGAGVAFAPNCQPFTFESFYEKFCSNPASATGSVILYVCEEDYYTNEDGKR